MTVDKSSSRNEKQSFEKLWISAPPRKEAGSGIELLNDHQQTPDHRLFSTLSSTWKRFPYHIDDDTHTEIVRRSQMIHHSLSHVDNHHHTMQITHPPEPKETTMQNAKMGFVIASRLFVLLGLLALGLLCTTDLLSSVLPLLACEE